MIKKTLGGDRLRSGNRMEVNMKSYERANHDLSHVMRTSMNVGTLVPIHKMIGLPGDTIDISTTAMIRTLPTAGPLFGSFKFQIDYFVCPMRLYIGALHNNVLNVGNSMDKVVLPKIFLQASPNTKFEGNPDIDTDQIAPDSLNAYLGIKGVGRNYTGGPVMRKFNGMYHLAYYDIFKNYYSNKQEEQAYVITTNVQNPINRDVAVAGLQTTSPREGVAGQQYMLDNDAVELENKDEWKFVAFTRDNLTEKELQNLKSIKLITLTTAVPASQPLIKAVEIDIPISKTLTDIVSWKFEIARNQQGNYLGISIFAAKRTSASGSYKVQVLSPATLVYNETIQNNELVSFPLTNIDNARTAILKHSDIGDYVTIQELNANPDQSNDSILSYPPYNVNAEFRQSDMTLLAKQSQCGLVVKTHLSDSFNNWIKSEWIDEVNRRSSITTSGNTFTLDALVVAKRVYNYLNRVAASGGTTQDWQEATWGVDAQHFAESPIFMGGMSGDIIFDEVVSTAAAEGEALGTLAGRGNIDNVKGGNVNIKIQEPSLIMGIMSITPRVDYSQGNDWDMFQIDTMEDLHKPEFDGISFQDLPTEWLAWWDTIVKPNYVTVRHSLGKQPAWVQYMSQNNRVYGDFARKNNAEFMVITRNYMPSERAQSAQNNQSDIAVIGDATSYIRPSNYTYLFGSEDIDLQPFWVQIGFDIKARRKLSGAIMPTL